MGMATVGHDASVVMLAGIPAAVPVHDLVEDIEGSRGHPQAGLDDGRAQLDEASDDGFAA
jgi:hypothetical protein